MNLFLILLLIYLLGFLTNQTITSLAIISISLLISYISLGINIDYLIIFLLDLFNT